jgi:hypothetical protein
LASWFDHYATTADSIGGGAGAGSRGAQVSIKAARQALFGRTVPVLQRCDFEAL